MKIYERYPYQFLDRRLLISAGWLPLFERLCADIDRVLGSDKHEFQWMDIRQKYGGLRLDWEMRRDCEKDDVSARVFRLITEAEDLSESTCEVCGQPGEIEQQAFWLDCLCSEHRRQRREVCTTEWRAGLSPVRLYDEEGRKP
jgi:hypothetical protein